MKITEQGALIFCLILLSWSHVSRLSFDSFGWEVADGEG